jgi:hypothetical protein
MPDFTGGSRNSTTPDSTTAHGESSTSGKPVAPVDARLDRQHQRAVMLWLLARKRLFHRHKKLYGRQETAAIWFYKLEFIKCSGERDERRLEQTFREMIEVHAAVFDRQHATGKWTYTLWPTHYYNPLNPNGIRKANQLLVDYKVSKKREASMEINFKIAFVQNQIFNRALGKLMRTGYGLEVRHAVNYLECEAPDLVEDFCKLVADNTMALQAKSEEIAAALPSGTAKISDLAKQLRDGARYHALPKD